MHAIKIRTEYTLGSCTARIPSIVAYLKGQGVTAACICDYASTFGFVEWQKECKKAGIKALYAVELDVTFIGRMAFLARDVAGVQALYRLTTKALREGIIADDVQSVAGELIVLAGECMDGEFLAGLDAVVDLAPTDALWQAEKKRQIAEKRGLKCVQVCDNAFITETDAENFRIYANTKKTKNKHIVLTNAEWLVAQCENVELPTAPMVSFAGDLRGLCLAGKRRRENEGLQWNETYSARLEKELRLIESKHFASYFLVVADLVAYAKSKMLVGVSRGSAAGSLVCYLCGITEVDPLPAGLIFERFIDESRADLPDIDLDFEDGKRHLVIEYLRDKYGAENTAQISTIQRLKGKSALIHVAKHFGIDLKVLDGVKQAVENAPDLHAVFENTPQGKELLAKFPEMHAALALEGVASHGGTHAAGVIICNAPLTDFCALNADGTAQVDKHSAETLNLLKIDVLGLRTLSILADAGVQVDWYKLPLNDKAVFEQIFQKDRLCGIFQFEGSAMRSVARKMFVQSIADVDAVTALARPATMAAGVPKMYIERKNGVPFERIHPAVDRILSSTYGLPVYQEQTIAIMREVGGFGWADAAAVRKAISKNIGVDFGVFYEKFKTGATKNGLTELQIERIWALLKTMGAWQMNKAHTHSYAIISFWCAWLKCHYPLHFAAANLRNLKNNDSAAAFLIELQSEGYKVVLFDVEKSEIDWAVKDGVLYGGFLTLKGFGQMKAQKYKELRDSGHLTQKQQVELQNAGNVFENAKSLQVEFKDYYEQPAMHNIAGQVLTLSQIEAQGKYAREAITIGIVAYKKVKNKAQVLLKKGKTPLPKDYEMLLFDLKIKDDNGEIFCRLDFEESECKKVFEQVVVGSILLLKLRLPNNLFWGLVKKVRILKGG